LHLAANGTIVGSTVEDKEEVGGNRKTKEFSLKVI
jgi:hypothetical protein